MNTVAQHLLKMHSFFLCHPTLNSREKGIFYTPTMKLFYGFQGSLLKAKKLLKKFVPELHHQTQNCTPKNQHPIISILNWLLQCTQKV